MKTKLFVFGAALAILLTAWEGLGPLNPSALSPMPMLTVIPAFIFSNLNYRLAALMPPLLFLALNSELLKGTEKASTKAYVLLCVASILSVLWFLDGWKLGLEYEGSQYTQVVFAVNVGWLLLLWGLAIVELKTAPSFAKNLTFQCAIFIWLSWYAFPYLGELP
jgi:hypothetical protein